MQSLQRVEGGGGGVAEAKMAKGEELQRVDRRRARAEPADHTEPQMAKDEGGGWRGEGESGEGRARA